MDNNNQATQVLRLDLAYQQEAQRLVDAGYQAFVTEGIVPCVFRRDDDELYLVRVTLQGHIKSKYKIAIVNESEIRPVDVPTRTVFIPKRNMPAGSATAYAWVPRRLADLPSVFTVRDAAEHLGLAIVTIEHASSNRQARHPLSSLSGRAKIFDEDTLLEWFASRRSAGQPTHKRYHRERLNLGKDKLLTRLRVGLQTGRLNATHMIRRMEEMKIQKPSGSDIVSILGVASNCRRDQLINLIAGGGEDRTSGRDFPERSS